MRVYARNESVQVEPWSSFSVFDAQRYFSVVELVGQFKDKLSKLISWPVLVASFPLACVEYNVDVVSGRDGISSELY